MHYAAMRLRICTIYQFVVHSQSCCDVSTQTFTSPPPEQKKQSLIYRKKWATTHTGTMKDGWKVMRKQFSAGF
jgi:hypothetical protein